MHLLRCIINQTFTVSDPLISDPILTVPITSWSKDDLIYINSKQVDDEDASKEIDGEEQSGNGGYNTAIKSDEEVCFRISFFVNGYEIKQTALPKMLSD